VVDEGLVLLFFGLKLVEFVLVSVSVDWEVWKEMGLSADCAGW
jgi:hypothetical protein